MSIEVKVEVKVEEQFVPKQTRWGTVQKSLNQHIVKIKNDDGQFMHIGYVGVKAFLPLAGVPEELVEPVTQACEKELGRKLERVAPPLSFAQIQQIIQGEKAESTTVEEELA